MINVFKNVKGCCMEEGSKLLLIRVRVGHVPHSQLLRASNKM